MFYRTGESVTLLGNGRVLGHVVADLRTKGTSVVQTKDGGLLILELTRVEELSAQLHARHLGDTGCPYCGSRDRNHSCYVSPEARTQVCRDCGSSWSGSHGCSISDATGWTET